MASAYRDAKGWIARFRPLVRTNSQLQMGLRRSASRDKIHV